MFFTLCSMPFIFSLLAFDNYSLRSIHHFLPNCPLPFTLANTCPYSAYSVASVHPPPSFDTSEGNPLSVRMDNVVSLATASRNAHSSHFPLLCPPLTSSSSSYPFPSFPYSLSSPSSSHFSPFPLSSPHFLPHPSYPLPSHSRPSPPLPLSHCRRKSRQR